ncbi:hypothetical protein P7K49_021677 [Saguinus oedipus]|uniref:Uteroglobin n=1 Tax=Saguinus oedipus TaxID=9490 RepID=A0ABQ9UU51_SAGOE|nr:hypothetical protein P7K49_021677 [Saguinus oedipus]
MLAAEVAGRGAVGTHDPERNLTQDKVSHSGHRGIFQKEIFPLGNCQPRVENTVSCSPQRKKSKEDWAIHKKLAVTQKVFTQRQIGSHLEHQQSLQSASAEICPSFLEVIETLFMGTPSNYEAATEPFSPDQDMSEAGAQLKMVVDTLSQKARDSIMKLLVTSTLHVPLF